MARRPSTRISRLTTLASTGRRMKISVKRIGPSPARSAVYGDGGGIVGGLHLVVHHNRGAVVQLDLSGRDDCIAGLDAAQNRHLVAARRTGGDETLPGNQRRLPRPGIGVL